MTDTTHAGSFKIRTYENGLLLLLAFTFGIVFFERNAINFLAAYIIPDLGLSQTQFGMLNSGLSLAWAVSAYGIGAWSDRSGARKPFLVVSIIVFSLCSLLSGIAGSFMMLLMSRVLMGAAEGPFLPICFSVMNSESSPKRRGVNAGILQNFFASLLGTSVAPVMMPWLATEFGWRMAFFLSAIPGLICAALVWKFVREPARTVPTPQEAAGEKPSLLSMLKQRNILVCCGISIFMVSWYLVGLSFLQVVFTGFKGLTPEVAGQVMAPMGFATMICGFVVPFISDRIGRKPTMIIFTFIGLVTPIAVVHFNGPLWMLSVLMLVGWSASGSFALFMGVIPSETVPRTVAASSMGLVVAAGEIFGGVVAPTLSGYIADHSSLISHMTVMMVCATMGGILSFFLKETAPAKTGFNKR
jgi:ACS family hexuronate transporter-like MFS transporter